MLYVFQPECDVDESVQSADLGLTVSVIVKNIVRAANRFRFSCHSKSIGP